MSRAENKSERLLQIEALLLAHPEGLTQAEIARRMGVNRSTIHRCLPELGRFCIYETDDGRLVIDRDHYLMNVRLTMHESMALHLAARLMATRTDKQNPHAAAALRKLGLALEKLAPFVSRHILASADVMDSQARRHDPVYLDVLETLTRAWSLQRKVRLKHQTPDQNVFEYTFSPYFVEPYAVGQTTHVIGWREPPGALRTFKLERIKAIELLDEAYTIPADFDPRALLADAWGIWYTEAEPVEVVLRFHPNAAARLRETRWHHSEKIEEQPDGFLVWRAQVAEPQEMIPWIQGWGANAMVLEPQELRERVRAQVRQLAQEYGLATGQQDSLAWRALRCWGKTDKREGEFHPAVFHMLDVGHVARELLSERASPRWRRVLAQALGAEAATLADWLPWLAAMHDIGKISEAFQGLNQEQKARLKAEGFSFEKWQPSLDLHHSDISLAFVEYELPASIQIPDALRRAWREAVAGHHGQFAPADRRKQARSALKAYESAEWGELRTAAARLVQEALLKRAPEPWPEPPNISTAIMALTGFTILCDWLGSDGKIFAPRPEADWSEYAAHSANLARSAVEASGFLQSSQSNAPAAFSALFADIKQPRPLQTAIDAIPAAFLSEPCLAIIEAPTGEGKTEAALALAHRLAQAGGTDEIYYALPTTATSNQMFGRLQRHLRDRLGLTTQIKLVHGQAFLVEDDLRIEPLDNGDGKPEAALEWFGPKKRALLAPFGVGTIDQAELAALNVRHTALRMMGLAGKVIIVDEVHAYDTYMTTIVERLLGWLAAMGASVILLSATLPQARRADLARAFGATLDTEHGQTAYPSLWVINRANKYHAAPAAQQPDRRLRLGALHFGDDDEHARQKAQWLLGATANGGCACWMVNTIGRAQKLFAALDALAPPDVDRLLLHARFPLDERQKIEGILADKYGPNGKRPQRGIVIGTQVLEQSLDLDFDVMVSDLAPVDLLLQRAGRLHRHERPRPAHHAEPHLWINALLDDNNALDVNIDKWVYAEFILRQTWQTIGGRAEINLPGDYRLLIEAVYGAPEPEPDSPLRPAWDKLQTQHDNAIGQANQRLLPEPDPEDAFCAPAARMQFEEDENSAAWIVAQTRLGEASVTAIPLEREGNLARISADGAAMSLEAAAPRETQLQLLRRSVRISNRDAVQALKAQDLPPLFVKSALLKDCLPLWLTDGQAQLPSGKNVPTLKLDPQLGLVIMKEKGV